MGNGTSWGVWAPSKAIGVLQFPVISLWIDLRIFQEKLYFKIIVYLYIFKIGEGHSIFIGCLIVAKQSSEFIEG